MQPEDKICSIKELPFRLETLPRPLVLTNGVFDLIHRGHVSYLHHAATLGTSLVVAVNSDRSVRLQKKGPDRPFVREDDRAYMLACLASVDLVVLFDDHTPIRLIELIRPNIYTKGGDYNLEITEESQIVRKIGGKSVSMPFLNGFSTSSLVDKIRKTQPPLLKAAFLDRDGVINIDKGYVYRWSEFEFLPGAIEGMRMLQRAGYELVIVTNQSGLARGYYTTNQYESLNNSFRQHLDDHGVELAGIFHCPHHPNGVIRSLSVECECRKPMPGLINQAINSLGLDRDKSILIGDKQSDIEAASRAGINQAYLVDSKNNQALSINSAIYKRFSSLLDCARHVIDHSVP